MKAEPLTKQIHTKAKELGIQNIILHFSGGSDEGYLDIEIIPYEKDIDGMAGMVEDWAWNVYDYSGAGEGSEYGDTIDYNLETGVVTTSEWYMTRQENEDEIAELEVTENEEE